MPINKVLGSFEEAVADVPNGASIMVGGFGGAGGMPQNLLLALSQRDVKDLTIIGNAPFFGEVMGPYMKRPYIDCNILLPKKQVKKAIVSFLTFSIVPEYLRGRRLLEEMATAGELEIEMVPQGTLAQRIVCGGSGLGGFYTPVGVGTLLAKGKETKVIDGKEYLLELPLKADYSFGRAHKADPMGNLIYKGTSRGFNPIMATAAKVTIAEVDKIVDIGELNPEHIVTPGIYVKRVVEIVKKEA